MSRPCTSYYFPAALPNRREPMPMRDALRARSGRPYLPIGTRIFEKFFVKILSCLRAG